MDHTTGTAIHELHTALREASSRESHIRYEWQYSCVVSLLLSSTLSASLFFSCQSLLIEWHSNNSSNTVCVDMYGSVCLCEAYICMVLRVCVCVCEAYTYYRTYVCMKHPSPQASCMSDRLYYCLQCPNHSGLPSCGDGAS